MKKSVTNLHWRYNHCAILNYSTIMHHMKARQLIQHKLVHPNHVNNFCIDNFFQGSHIYIWEIARLLFVVYYLCYDARHNKVIFVNDYAMLLEYSLNGKPSAHMNRNKDSTIFSRNSVSLVSEPRHKLHFLKKKKLGQLKNYCVGPYLFQHLLCTSKMGTKKFVC